MHASSFQCTVCGFFYKNNDDQPSGADRHCSFTDLPASWQCPGCGVLKNLFRSVKNILDNQTSTQNPNGDKKQ